MSFAENIARDRRRAILEHLAVTEGLGLGAGVLTTLIAEGRHGIYRDVIEADLAYLAQHNLLTVEELPSALGPQKWATLTGLGLDVAGGRTHPHVAPKLPSY
ncbi:hypothetical protein V5F77_28405 [Xanthobacter sp. DSM 24535]|uniref:hypothetical protein n=1 Tax=Roseixanthobacter psychrophilus TaxID=3119917 RepID=UPI00372C21B6